MTAHIIPSQLSPIQLHFSIFPRNLMFFHKRYRTHRAIVKVFSGSRGPRIETKRIVYGTRNIALTTRPDPTILRTLSYIHDLIPRGKMFILMRAHRSGPQLGPLPLKLDLRIADAFPGSARAFQISSASAHIFLPALARETKETRGMRNKYKQTPKRSGDKFSRDFFLARRRADMSAEGTVVESLQSWECLPGKLDDYVEIGSDEGGIAALSSSEDSHSVSVALFAYACQIKCVTRP